MKLTEMKTPFLSLSAEEQLALVMEKRKSRNTPISRKKDATAGQKKRSAAAKKAMKEWTLEEE